MKSILPLIFLLFVGTQLLAQNSYSKANDEDRIAIGVKETDLGEDIPDGSFTVLSNRLSKAASLNGMAVQGEDPVFNMVPQVSILDKVVSGTVPPMITTEIEVAIKLVQSLDGKSYEQVNFTLKGVGQNEEKSFTDALRKINARDPKLRAFFREGKEKILEYYNGHCDIILAKADGYVSAKRYLDAYHLLMNVPPASRECFDKCIEKIAEFGDMIPAEYQVPDPQPEELTPDNKPSADPQKRVVLANGLVIQYESGNNYGEQTILNFKIINSTGSDKEVKTDPDFIKLINGQGEEIKMQSLRIGNRTETYRHITYTILPDTPVEMECIFPNNQYIRQLVMKINDNIYRLDRLPLR
jgi:hypothetical protein